MGTRIDRQIKKEIENTQCMGRLGGAQSVKPLISAQVTISRFVSSSPETGSVLTAQSLEPVSGSVLGVSLFPPPLPYACSVSLKNK